ncbi:MAG: peptide chain release factor N(5)-glutamine methyltransferase [Leptolyngbyaceae cyanobacterium CSU_1_3]|nr:peptide chain release factor N(5)-glutamine methyltransferase [Leptolyngbyaceae cyanobacterium CSU_1_3]
MTSGAVSGLQLWQWRSQSQKSAIAAAIPPSEVDWLLQELTGLDRLSLRLDTYKSLPQVDLKVSFLELDGLWQQRIESRIPVQYLAGTASWRHFKLQVSPAVLIPRPETEELIDLAIAATQIDPSLQTGDWADLGTGSGAIALGLADALPHATIHAVDRSQAALAIAQQNARTLGLSDRIRFYHGSWLEPLASLKGNLKGVVANPPYIPSQMVLDLQPEVLHEPHTALDGGIDGLDCIRHLVAVAPDYLQADGVWMVEMMAGQSPQVIELLRQQRRYDRMAIHRDLAGVERFAIAHLQSFS